MEENVHVIKILVDLVLKSRTCDDHTQMNKYIQESARTITRAVNAKEELLTTQEVELAYPFLTERNLQNMRYRGFGPTYYKFGKTRNSRVFYKKVDIEAWILENKQLTPFVEGLRVVAEDINPS